VPLPDFKDVLRRMEKNGGIWLIPANRLMALLFLIGYEKEIGFDEFKRFVDNYTKKE